MMDRIKAETVARLVVQLVRDVTAGKEKCFWESPAGSIRVTTLSKLSLYAADMYLCAGRFFFFPQWLNR